MYPPIAHIERVAQRDDVLPLRFPVKDRKTGKDMHSIRIRKGQVSTPSRFPITHEGRLDVWLQMQVLFFSTFAMHRSKAIWGPDADQFKAERWLTPPSEERDGKATLLDAHVSPLPPSSHLGQGWNGLFTFVEGSRMCIGIRLGEYMFQHYPVH